MILCNNPGCYNFVSISPVRVNKKSSLRMRSQLFLNGHGSYPEITNAIM